MAPAGTLCTGPHCPPLARWRLPVAGVGARYGRSGHGSIDRQTLARIGGSEVPLAEPVPDGEFPIIVRPVDSQKGHGLVKLDNPAAVADYLGTRPEVAFYVAHYVEYRGADGLFRKYRIVLIDGRPYACHMAISDSWVVHYMSAGMLESAAKREEEARFFATSTMTSRGVITMPWPHRQAAGTGVRRDRLRGDPRGRAPDF